MDAAPRIQTSRRLLLLGLGALWLLVLWAPLLQMCLRLVVETPLAEKRARAARPVFGGMRPAALKRYAEGLDRWFTDHFGFRDTLIRANNRAQVRLLVTSPSPLVILGKKGWLFYNSDYDGPNLTDFCGLAPFAEGQLAGMQMSLEAITRSFAARGITFCVVVPPSKHTIYPEYLPGRLRALAGKTRLDQVAARLGSSPVVRFLDLRPAMRAGKSRHLVFLMTDTHWNDYGAFLGSRAVLELLAREFPGLAVPPGEVEVKASARGDSDLEDLLAAGPLPDEGNVGVRRARRLRAGGGRKHRLDQRIVREFPGAGRPRLLMFRDSFAMDMIPHLSPAFSRSVFIWSTTMYQDLVDMEKPDVVILEVTERFLGRLAEPRLLVGASPAPARTVN